MQLCCVVMIYTLSLLEKKTQQCYFRQIAGSSNRVLFFHWDKDIPKGKYEQKPFTLRGKRMANFSKAG